jgi:hypothetical protein
MCVPEDNNRHWCSFATAGPAQPGSSLMAPLRAGWLEVSQAVACAAGAQVYPFCLVGHVLRFFRN